MKSIWNNYRELKVCVWYLKNLNSIMWTSSFTREVTRISQSKNILRTKHRLRTCFVAMAIAAAGTPLY